MDSSVNPCENFHHHVCNGFNPRKKDFERLMKLINIQEKPDHRKAVNVVRRMLSKCAMGKTEEIHQVGRLR